LAFGALLLSERGGWRGRLFDADAGAFYDSNLSRAQKAADVRADAAASFAASTTNFFALSGNDGLTLSIDGSGEAYHRFHGLNFLVTIVGACADAETYRFRRGTCW
jgi:hypothetical protein